MTVAEIYNELKNLEISERRRQDDNFVELVFHTKDLASWLQALEKIFGPALKPINEKPGAEALKETQQFGGIRREQALFRKSENQQNIIAMLWPWQSGQSITIKIIQC